MVLVDDLYLPLLEALHHLQEGEHPTLSPEQCRNMAWLLQEHLTLVAFHAETIPLENRATGTKIGSGISPEAFQQALHFLHVQDQLLRELSILVLRLNGWRKCICNIGIVRFAQRWKDLAEVLPMLFFDGGNQKQADDEELKDRVKGAILYRL
jgi:hypothetical protein